MYCADNAAAELLAGSAPEQSHWLFVEAPGAWGRDALSSSSLNPQQRASLAGLPGRWRVVLVRRADRPLRTAAQRRVWLSTPGEVRQWRLALDDPVDPASLTDGDTVSGEVLFVCTNGGRDRCCALRGRPVLESLDSDRAWECSHLGGHRFAPTAVRLGDRMVFGRLGEAAAREALAGRTPLDHVRGPAGWPPAVQAAAVAVWRHHATVPIDHAEDDGSGVRLRLADRTRWRVPVVWTDVPARQLSCGAPPSPGRAPTAGPAVLDGTW